MGLTIHYELTLPATCSEADAFERMSSLRQRALDLPFKVVTDILRLDGATLGELPPMRGLNVRKVEDVVQIGGHLDRETLYRESIGLTDDDEMEEDESFYRPIDVPSDVTAVCVGFVVVPGDGCEPATFALTRLTGSGSSRWLGRCSCKTQYASAVSDDHFVACHGALVALLDAAIALGIQAVVHDEGGYWESRDDAQLLAAVGHMNRLVARLGGAITDAMRAVGGDSHRIEGAIFEHPDFERLETEGSREL